MTHGFPTALRTTHGPSSTLGNSLRRRFRMSFNGKPPSRSREIYLHGETAGMTGEKSAWLGQLLSRDACSLKLSLSSFSLSMIAHIHPATGKARGVDNAF